MRTHSLSLLASTLFALVAATGCETALCAETPEDPACDPWICCTDPGSEGCAAASAEDYERYCGSSDGGVVMDGDAGSADASACDMACTGDRSICDPDTGECVECTEADTSACATGEDFCNEMGECVECRTSTDCPEGTPICDRGTCQPCSTRTECADRDPALPVCDMGAGTCVQCTTEDASECPEGVCKPDGTCSDHPAEQVACRACDTDANCAEGLLCVELRFGGEPYGSFCQWRRDAAPPGPDGQCADERMASQPWYLLVPGAESVDDETADICTLRTTTCPAFLQHQTEVTGCEEPFDDDAACGVEGVSDGRCRDNPGGNPRCTYPCAADEDCPSPFTCPAPGGDRVCSI